MASTFSDFSSKIAVSITKINAKFLISLSFFNNIQIGPLNVFNNRYFEGLLICCFNYTYGNIKNGSELCCSPTSLSSNNLKPIARMWRLSNQYRLKHPASADRLRKFSELRLVEKFAWIKRIWPQMLEWHTSLRSGLLKRSGLILRFT